MEANITPLCKANGVATFNMTSGKGPNSSKGKKNNITCYKCNKEGHYYLNECEEDNKDTEDSKKGSRFLDMRQKRMKLKKKAMSTQVLTKTMMTRMRIPNKKSKALNLFKRTFYALYKMKGQFQRADNALWMYFPMRSC